MPEFWQDARSLAECQKFFFNFQDFGNIFSTLLPGTSAKLEPPYGAKSALDGLEVKVAFRGQWKDSLGELSGGYVLVFLLIFFFSKFLLFVGVMFVDCSMIIHSSCSDLVDHW